MAKAFRWPVKRDPIAARGDRAEVSEENIRPWTGMVTSVKWSPRSGWWYEVKRDDDGMTWVVAEANVKVLERGSHPRSVGSTVLTSPRHGEERRPVMAPKTVAKRAPKRVAAKPKAESNGSGVFSGHEKRLERFQEDGAAILKATGGDASKVAEAAEKLGMGIGKARRMFAFAKLPKKDRLYESGLSEKEIGTKLIALNDSGLKWDPDIWAYMLTTEQKGEELYKLAGGKDWQPKQERAPRAPRAAKPAAKKTGPAKRVAKRAPKRTGTSR